MSDHKNILLRVIMVAACIVACGSQCVQALDISHFADSSKLAGGRWVKIQVDGTGIHQITADDARAWGFSDLGSLHVFGMGGLPVNERLTEDIPDDLPQLPTVRTPNSLLFYAQGPTNWRTDNSYGMPYVPVQHPYSNHIYYLVSDDSRYADVDAPQRGVLGDGAVEHTFVEHLCHELDLVNPGESGRVYLGEDFTAKSQQSFAFDLKGKVAGTDVNVLTVLGVKMPSGTARATFQYNGTNTSSSASDQMTGVSSDNPYQLIASKKTFNLDDNNALNYSVKLDISGPASMARLDYVAVTYTRQLALEQGQLCFDAYHMSTATQLQLGGAGPSTHVWDVTEPWSPIAMNTELDGSTLRFSPVMAGQRRYVAFNGDGGNYARATLSGPVNNQNLHGEAVPDMIIIAPGEYVDQARRIAQLHERVDSMRVLVVNERDVFNEFSGGTPDAMAYRMMCKMFYDRGRHSGGTRLGYLLLLGKGTFDNRLVTNTIRSLNAPMLLTWQSENSYSHEASYTTDDYFGMLEDNSGPRAAGANNTLSIAVGRMTVKSLSEAKTVVDKLVNYVSKPDYGWWKNNVLNVADDGNSGIHMEQAEDVITAMRANGGNDFFFNRVYIDAFTGVSEGAKRTYPDANTKHYNTLRNGVVWWNYTGHSGPHAMTDNGLLRHTDLDTKFYYKHLPVLYAATCDFNKFDGTEESGGETLFLNPRGGVIALVCPPRPVYISYNGTLNANVGRYVFSRDEQGQPRRLGDIIRLSKNLSSDENRLRYFLVGDPAMRLSYPTHKIQVESIQGAQEHTSSGMPVFRGRQTMTVSGVITDYQGQPMPQFNGTITTELFDYEQSITSHGYGDDGDGEKVTFLDRTNKLAVSIDSVRNGRFTARIALPSELLPRPEAGGNSVLYDNFSPSLLNMYAYSVRDSIEAIGSSDRFIIYGYDDTAVTDTVGPEIHYLGLNSENFSNGDAVNESPLVIASISDNSGINYSSAGIGHSMTLTLDGTTSYSNMIDYFTPRATTDGSSGTLSFALSELSEGPHQLRLRVWDVYNNASERTVNFTVVKGLKPEIEQVYASSNPARYETSFYVKHNRPDAILSVTIEVYDLMGRKVWSTRQSGMSDTYTSFPVTWDLHDSSGRRVPRGIYAYRAIISTDGVQEATKSKKLAVTSE